MPRLVVCLLIATLLSGQSEKKRLAFDAVSIKLHKPGEPPGVMGIPPGGRFTASNTGLEVLIKTAYLDYGMPVPWSVIEGLPGWAEKDRFDVEAQPEPGFTPTKQQSMEMLRTMLEERFKLKIRRELRNASIYSLVVDRGGSKMKPSANQSGSRPCLSGAPPAGLQRFCSSTSMAMLSIRLYGQVGRRIVDKTGLSGLYDMDLVWMPDPLANAAVDSGGPSLFTALQEQLGLRLVSETGLVDTFVVESVERPSEN